MPTDTQEKYQIGDTVSFAYREGKVIGYTTLCRTNDVYRTYLIVELDSKSAAYLEAIAPHRAHDCFISAMIVNPDNVANHNGKRVE